MFQQMLLLSSESDNYIMWISMLLCSIGGIVILKNRKK